MAFIAASFDIIIIMIKNLVVRNDTAAIMKNEAIAINIVSITEITNNFKVGLGS